MQRVVRILTSVSTVLLGFLAGAPVRAGGLLNAEGELKNAGRPAFGAEQVELTGTAFLAQRVGLLINIFLTVVGSIFLILMIYGGYLWMMARGDTEKVKKAKELITDAVIGLIIIFAAYAISAFVVSRIISATTLEG